MEATVDAQLRADDVAFTESDAALIRAIAEAGSVSGAATTLGRSRARALARIETLEEAFGPLVDRQRGGQSGGGSELTDAGETVLARFDRLQASLAGTAAVAECVLSGRVTDRTGELGVIETDAGTIQARLLGRPGRDPPDVGSLVQVSVRSDAVTVQAPEDTPPLDGTSARNRFEGTVTAIDPGTAIVTVTVDIGGSESLVALLTQDSRERLALETGSPVVVFFKATATRAIGID